MLTELFERATCAGAASKLCVHRVLARRASVVSCVVPGGGCELKDGLLAARAVITRLADEVFGFVISNRPVDETAIGNSMQLISGALAKHAFEVASFRVCRPKLLLQFIDLVTRRRLLFLQRQRCVLHVDHAIVDRLLHLGELQFVASCDCCFCKINSVFQAGNGCRYGHDRHLVPRLEMDRARPRRNHHSAVTVGFCARRELA